MIKKIRNNISISYYKYKFKKDDNILDINMSISELIVGLMVSFSEEVTLEINLEHIVPYMKLMNIDDTRRDRVKNKYRYLNVKYPGILKYLNCFKREDLIDDCKYGELNYLREKYKTRIFDALFGFDYEVKIHVDKFEIPHVSQHEKPLLIYGPEFSIKIHPNFYDVKRETIDNTDYVLFANEHSYCENKLMELLEGKEFPVGEYFLILNSSWTRDELDKRLSELVNSITNIHG